MPHKFISESCLTILIISTDKWAEHVYAGTIETILIRGKFKFHRLGSVFRQTIHKLGVFDTGYKMAISVQSPVEGELFPSRCAFVPKHLSNKITIIIMVIDPCLSVLLEVEQPS